MPGGFFNRIFHGKGAAHIPPGAAFRITEQGKDKLQEYGGDPKSRVLVALETRGTSDVDEISKATGLTKGQVERLIPVLLRGGNIQFVTNAMAGDDL
jgi:hypothetical protein